MTAHARILIVEDDPTIRASVAGSLADEGLLVRAEADGRRIEEVLDMFRPDLVVLDWMLPGRG